MGHGTRIVNNVIKFLFTVSRSFWKAPMIFPFAAFFKPWICSGTVAIVSNWISEFGNCVLAAFLPVLVVNGVRQLVAIEFFF